MWAQLFGQDTKQQGNGNGSNENGHGSHDRQGDAERISDENSSLLFLQEILRLVNAFQEGRLSERGKASELKSVHREAIEGVNKILDSVSAPLHVASKFLEHIGKGEIPAKIAEDYNGEFNVLKNNLNACVDGLSGLVETNAVLWSGYGF